MMFVFDLDGTLANYDEDISQEVADCLNNLVPKPYYIVTSGNLWSANARTQKLTGGFHLLSNAGHQINCAAIKGVSKEYFRNSKDCQFFRLELCRYLIGHGIFTAEIAGRATINVPKDTKLAVLRRDYSGGYVYFCDEPEKSSEFLSAERHISHMANKVVWCSPDTVIERIKAELPS